MAANNRSQALFDTFDRLSTREKIMVGGLFALLADVDGGAYIIIGSQIEDLEERNESIQRYTGPSEHAKGQLSSEKSAPRCHAVQA